jgi:hypothetical protein
MRALTVVVVNRTTPIIEPDGLSFSSGVWSDRLDHGGTSLPLVKRGKPEGRLVSVQALRANVEMEVYY